MKKKKKKRYACKPTTVGYHRRTHPWFKYLKFTPKKRNFNLNMVFLIQEAVVPVDNHILQDIRNTKC